MINSFMFKILDTLYCPKCDSPLYAIPESQNIVYGINDCIYKVYCSICNENLRTIYVCLLDYKEKLHERLNSFMLKAKPPLFYLSRHDKELLAETEEKPFKIDEKIKDMKFFI